MANDFLTAAQAAGFSMPIENISRHTNMTYQGLEHQGLDYLNQIRSGLSGNATSQGAPGTAGVPSGGYPSVYGYSPTTGGWAGNMGGPTTGGVYEQITGGKFDPWARVDTSAGYSDPWETAPTAEPAAPQATTGGLGGLGGMPQAPTAWGSNWGGDTSPVYRPNQTQQPRNGWGGPWGSSNPFAPTF